MLLREQFGNRAIQIKRVHDSYSIIRTCSKCRNATIVLHGKDEIKQLVDMLLKAHEEPLPKRDADTTIEDIVCYEMGIEHGKLFKKDRHANIMYAKHFFRYFSYLSGVNFNQQEKLYGYDHVAAWNGYKVIVQLIASKFPMYYYECYLKINEQIKSLNDKESKDNSNGGV